MQVFDYVTYHLWEIIEAVKISLLQPHNGEDTLVLKDRGPGAGDLSFSEKRHRAFGKCYTLHPEDWIRKLGINILEIKRYEPGKIKYFFSQKISSSAIPI